MHTHTHTHTSYFSFSFSFSLLHACTHKHTHTHAHRGGISFVSTRYARARPPKFPGDTTRVIMQIDVNALYSHAMSQLLPVSDYAWMSREELDAIDWTDPDLDTEGTTGYILEVTLDVPEDVHEKLDQVPLCPETMVITEKDLSTHTLDLMEEVEGSRRHKSIKLASTMKRKEQYAVHMTTLKTYLKHGLKLVAVSRGVKFTQGRPFLPYIQKCIGLRKQATANCELITAAAAAAAYCLICHRQTTLLPS